MTDQVFSIPTVLGFIFDDIGNLDCRTTSISKSNDQVHDTCGALF